MSVEINKKVQMKHTDLDAPETTIRHGQIIKTKKFLKKIYVDFYEQFKEIYTSQPNGKFLEIGSGAGFVKELYPNMITSDVLFLPNNDLIFSAMEMPFKRNSIDGIFMIDTFHHIPNVSLFLKEVIRILKPGGTVLMIEPANTLWSRFVYKNFHHEAFEQKAGWLLPEGGPLSVSNIALPWIVFYRDNQKFETEFHELVLKRAANHTPFRYLISGGVSFPQFVPDFLYGFVKFLEHLFSPLNKYLGMFLTIELEKRERIR